jgi:hypothetical protein
MYDFDIILPDPVDRGRIPAELRIIYFTSNGFGILMPGIPGRKKFVNQFIAAKSMGELAFKGTGSIFIIWGFFTVYCEKTGFKGIFYGLL